MKSLTNKTIVILFLFISVFSTEIRSQNFTTSTLIDIPGNNIEFDISAPQFVYYRSSTYICWINILDSVYTVYLKQISPVMGNNIVVASDSIIKCRPKVAGVGQSLTIAWQTKENFWKVHSKHYDQNNLVDSSLILDSLTEDPQISMSISKIAWIENGNLFIKSSNDQTYTKTLFDSLVCNSPQLYKYATAGYMRVVYEKKYSDSTNICLISYYDMLPVHYEYRTITSGKQSKNPTFGLDAGIAYQTYENGIWRSECTLPFPYSSFFTTHNAACNCINPVLFSYPIPITDNSNFTLYFLAFESDSLQGNKEIFTDNFLFGSPDYLTNISNAPGNDYLPDIGFLTDTTKNEDYIALFWEHQFNGKTDIWMAKDVFNPITGNIDNAKTTAQSFDLQQNYPNPFNPSTVIRFSIPKDEIVILDVYNSLGQKVCELLNGKYSSGTHEVKWNAQGFASGVYFCRLVSASKQITKKIVLMK